MSTKKKVLIGAGIAVVAVAAAAGGLYLAKRHKRHQQAKLLDSKGGYGTRDISSLNSGGDVHPSLLPYLGMQENKAYLTNTEPLPVPDALTIGLGWDSDTALVNLDLVASVFNSSGQSIGYVQGSSNKLLFNGGVSHSGDDTAGSNLSSILGDNEHVTIDFRLVPPEATTIVVGALLVTGSGLRNAYLNVLPLLRQDSVPTNAVSVEYDSDSDDDSSPSQSNKAQNYGSGPEDDGDEELILLYKSKIDQQHQNFQQARGLIAFKLIRSAQYGGWQLIPIRQVVNLDQQYGLWPSLEYYQHYQAGAQPQQQQQQQYPPQQGYNQGYVQPQQQQYQQPGFNQGYNSAPYGQAPGYGSGFPQQYPQQGYPPQQGGYPQQGAPGGWGNPNPFGAFQ